RQGQTDSGKWFGTPGDTWRDEGFWYSSRLIASETKRPDVPNDIRKVHKWLREVHGVTKYRSVPVGPNGVAGKEVMVHHESQVRHLFDLPAITANEHKRPERVKHLKWKQWKDEGLSYNRIVQREQDETGDEYSRNAVIQALRRL